MGRSHVIDDRPSRVVLASGVLGIGVFVLLCFVGLWTVGGWVWSLA